MARWSASAPLIRFRQGVWGIPLRAFLQNKQSGLVLLSRQQPGLGGHTAWRRESADIVLSGANDTMARNDEWDAVCGHDVTDGPGSSWRACLPGEFGVGYGFPPSDLPTSSVDAALKLCHVFEAYRDIKKIVVRAFGKANHASHQVSLMLGQLFRWIGRGRKLLLGICGRAIAKRKPDELFPSPSQSDPAQLRGKTSANRMVRFDGHSCHVHLSSPLNRSDLPSL